MDLYVNPEEADGTEDINGINSYKGQLLAMAERLGLSFDIKQFNVSKIDTIIIPR